MIETIQTANYFIAIGGIIAMLATIVIVIDLKTTKSLTKIIESFGIPVAFIATLGATVMSLVYSEIFGLIPCGLCWLERMFLFPQVVLLAVSLYYKEKSATLYGIAFSCFGLCISLYHHYLQMGGSEFIKCPAAGVGADCTKRFFFEFGFITFPLMSAILFGFLIALYVYARKVSTR